jgi:hypothetical protein
MAMHGDAWRCIARHRGMYLSKWGGDELFIQQIRFLSGEQDGKEKLVQGR